MSTDSLITLLITIILIPAAVIPYLRKHRKKEKVARTKFEKAKIAGLVAAVTMHPHIDAMGCIGCGGCVDACPEHDVLAVINGKAVLIHGSKCVGHALCADACPVGGITMMMAAPGKSADLPILNEHLETTVKGVFIAGELGGMGLIRNALNQGLKTVAHIASLPKAGGNVYDVAIVGAGPAGMGAGLAAISHKLKYVMLDQTEAGGTVLQYPRRKIVMTSPIELPIWGKLKLTEVSKESLLETWMQIRAKAGLKVTENQKVTNIVREGNTFILTTPSQQYQASYVVLCLGRRGTPRKLGVEGEALSKVTYRLIDAESYQNVDALIVGGGDSAVEAAMGLALQGTNRVTLSYRKGELTRLKDRNVEHLQQYLKKKAITIIFNSEVKTITEKDVTLDTKEGPKVIPNDYVFVFAGGEMPFAFLKQVGVEFHNQMMN
jgi:thioredoxin reductase (NADPH)